MGSEKGSWGADMQRDKFRSAVMLCAAVALAAAAVPTSASAKSPSHARAVAVDCFSNSQVRPGEFLIACGDGNNRLIALHWSKWGATSAVGSGLDAVNDCQPYCAAGKFHSYPVTVRLDRPKSWQRHPEVQQFTRLQLVYTGAKPAQTQQVVTYKLWD
ncbi:hypothetical protein [Streptomyces sp. NPDC093149]|uniref:hypothetical protein n=1 Tax=Streptomyces sp. NPDC093149 TaxID=3366031 RepID=UPI003827AB9F